MAIRKDSPQKAAMREMMRDYLKKMISASKMALMLTASCVT